MQTFADEIVIIAAASLLLLLITTFVIVVVVIHEKRRLQFIQEKEAIENAFHQELLKSHLEIKEETLTAITQEIHDNIGQMLSLAKLNLHALHLDDGRRAEEKLADTRELIATAINDLRNLSHLFNSDYVMNENLSKVLDGECRRIGRLGMFEVDCLIEGEELSVDKHKQLMLFRIVQEALNNAIKHAQPRKVTCTLVFATDTITITIHDDGIGFDETPTGRGVGLMNMSHRCELLKGKLMIKSERGSGTTVGITVPAQGIS